jgi:hypothetical protein
VGFPCGGVKLIDPPLLVPDEPQSEFVPDRDSQTREEESDESAATTVERESGEFEREIGRREREREIGSSCVCVSSEPPPPPLNSLLVPYLVDDFQIEKGWAGPSPIGYSL